MVVRFWIEFEGSAKQMPFPNILGKEVRADPLDFDLSHLKHNLLPLTESGKAVDRALGRELRESISSVLECAKCGPALTHLNGNVREGAEKSVRYVLKFKRGNWTKDVTWGIWDHGTELVHRESEQRAEHRA